MKRLGITLVMAALLWPGVSLAQQVGQSAGAEFAKGVAAPVPSLVYFPVKLSMGIAGALLGGISGWATGGDERAAQSIWRPMTGGTYFVTPEVLEGKQPFLPFNGGTAAPPQAGPAPSGSTSMQR